MNILLENLMLCNLFEDINSSLNDLAIKKAIKYFGTTTNFNEVGYITTDGKLLDFSGKKFGGDAGSRTIDHRDISDADIEFPQVVSDTYKNSNDMIAFMDLGNIRFMPESQGIDIHRPLTDKQKVVLNKYFNKVGGEIVLDMEDTKNKKPLKTIEYPRGTKAIKIFKDIEDYFSGEEVKPVSKVVQFRTENIDKSKIDATDYIHQQDGKLSNMSLTNVNKVITLLDMAKGFKDRRAFYVKDTDKYKEYFVIKNPKSKKITIDDVFDKFTEVFGRVTPKQKETILTVIDGEDIYRRPIEKLIYGESSNIKNTKNKLNYKNNI